MDLFSIILGLTLESMTEFFSFRDPEFPQRMKDTNGRYFVLVDGSILTYTLHDSPFEEKHCL